MSSSTPGLDERLENAVRGQVAREHRSVALELVADLLGDVPVGR